MLQGLPAEQNIMIAIGDTIPLRQMELHRLTLIQTERIRFRSQLTRETAGIIIQMTAIHVTLHRTQVVMMVEVPAVHPHLLPEVQTVLVAGLEAEGGNQYLSD